MAWTKEPVLRTFQVQMTAITLLRLLQLRLEKGRKTAWWEKPEWNPHKTHASLLDLRRLLWQHREEFSKLLSELEDFEKFAPDLPQRRTSDLAAA